MKIIIVFGTRPEAVKMAPLIHALRAESSISLRICITAQHREMLDQILRFFNIQADYDLNIMKSDQSLTGICTAVLQKLDPILDEFQPDFLLVQGDTTTTFAASLAAFFKKIPVGHVEAGLRTGNPYSPWPEEVNRTLTSSLTRIHFVPTEQARANLLQEGKNPGQIFLTGNTVVDALNHTIDAIDQDNALQLKLREEFKFLDAAKKTILVTAHRRESFGEGLENICKALLQLSERKDVQIVYPVHLNPKVKEPVERLLGQQSNIHLIEPQDYTPFVYLMGRSYIILTDSGGVQEEAPTLGKPILVMRDTTERPEGIKAGVSKLVGTSSKNIYLATVKLIDSKEAYNNMAKSNNPYGDGHAAKRITHALISFDHSI